MFTHRLAKDMGQFRQRNDIELHHTRVFDQDVDIYWDGVKRFS